MFEFLESVPQITFYGNGEDQGQGRRAVMGCAASPAAGCRGARGRVLGEPPQPGLPYLPRLRFGAAVVATHFSIATVAS